MELTLIAVGKLRSFYREAGDEYAARLRRYTAFREVEVREEGREPTMNARMDHEAARIEAKLPDRAATLVALTRHGAPWSSAELARIVVIEQLYRGFTMLRGEPYHKGSADAP